MAPHPSEGLSLRLGMPFQMEPHPWDQNGDAAGRISNLESEPLGDDPTDQSANGNEEPEGLGSDSTGSWGDYPLDELLIRNESRTIYEVSRRIDQGTYIMDPDFQRDFIWKENKQSRLIESVIMRIPLPVFILQKIKKKDSHRRRITALIHLSAISKK